MWNHISNFNAVIGKGKVTKTSPLTQPLINNAYLLSKKNIKIKNENSCDVISLDLESNAIVAVATCGLGKLFLCPGGIGKCDNKYLGSAKLVNSNKVVMRSSFSRRRYIVEFYKDKLIYRIQDKNCFIKYPHGCLIYGFGWHDQFTYVFTH